MNPTKHHVVFIAVSILAASLAIKVQSSAATDTESKLPIIREWIIPPEPQSDDPQAWLDRILKVQEDEAEISQAMFQRPHLQDKTNDMYMQLGLLDERTVQKLISFGKPSIKPCINDLAKKYKNHNTSYWVLEGLGDLSVEPLTKLMHDDPESIPEIYQVFMGMKKNTSNELVRLSCTAGDTRAGAIDILAYMARHYGGTNEDESCVLGRPNAVDEDKRPLLLHQLYGEKDATIRANLATTLRIFKSPDDKVISALCELLISDPAKNVRTAAAETLQEQLGSSTAKGSSQIISALTQALAAENDDETKIACSEALRFTRFPVNASTITNLRNVISANAQESRLRFSAQRTLSHQAVYNYQTIPDMREALKANDYPTMFTALDSCIALGPKAEAAMPELKIIAKNNTFSMSQKALEAIKAIHPNSPAENLQ